MIQVELTGLDGEAWDIINKVGRAVTSRLPKSVTSAFKTGASTACGIMQTDLISSALSTFGTKSSTVSRGLQTAQGLCTAVAPKSPGVTVRQQPGVIYEGPRADPRAGTRAGTTPATPPRPTFPPAAYQKRNVKTGTWTVYVPKGAGLGDIEVLNGFGEIEVLNGGELGNIEILSGGDCIFGGCGLGGDVVVASGLPTPAPGVRDAGTEGEWYKNPFVLGGIGAGVLALGVTTVLLTRRRRRAA